MVNDRSAESVTLQDALTLGMTEAEFSQLLSTLGRAPNPLELSVVAALWSEHCSYKSSRGHFHHFPKTSAKTLVGPGENAGALDIGHGWAVVFKIESHNHPSFIEPYQGAMTGVGGIVRDVFTMGARPIALLNSLCFGELHQSDTRRLVEGVVRGIGDYGNCMGIPTVGGRVTFHAAYAHNILVNVFCAGLARHNEIIRGTADGIGNVVILLGTPTGRDGVGGAVMASASFGESAVKLRPAVQVGDPFLGKKLMECCLELFRTGWITGAQDLGAAGLSSAAFEMAARGSCGLRLFLDRILLNTADLSYRDILLSETQERMLLVVDPNHVDDVLVHCASCDVPAASIGVVTDTGRIECVAEGSLVLDLGAKDIVTRAPLLSRPWICPTPRSEAKKVPFNPPVDVEEALVRLLTHPDFADKRFIYEQFDSTVSNRTALGPPASAAVMLVPESPLALAFSLDHQSHGCAQDPYLGAWHTVFEGARNVTNVGAVPIGISDNLNLGDPTVPEISGQLVEMIRGIGDACRALHIPVISGNVSLYNQTGDNAILPTPTITTVGIVEDSAHILSPGFKQPGDIIAVVGPVVDDDHFTANISAYRRIILDDPSGAVPPIHVESETTTLNIVRECIHNGWLQSTQDCSTGGLLIALVRTVFYSSSCAVSGFSVTVPHNADPMTTLFGEGLGRFVISFSPAFVASVQQHCDLHRVPLTIIGQVQAERMTVRGLLEVETARLKTAWSNVFSRAMGFAPPELP